METENMSYQSLSAEKVEQDENLLNIILLRMPAKSLVKSKCVSERWLFLISDSKFANDHTRNNFNRHVSGLYSDSRPLVNFITESTNGHQSLPNLNFLSTTNLSEVTIYHSCNGLMLCSRGPELIVCNLTTQKLKVIPSFHDPFPFCINEKFIAFDPSKSLHYKIVVLEICINDVDGEPFGLDGSYCLNSYDADIYFAKSRSWKRISFNDSGTYPFTERVFCDGSIYWIDEDNKLLKFNIDEENWEIVQLLSQPSIVSDDCFVWFGELGGCLFLIHAIPSTEFDLRLLEMDMQTFNWNIKFIVDLEPTINTFLGVKDLQSVQVWSLKEGDDKEKPMLIFAIKGKIISYNPDGDRVEFLEGVLGDAQETNKRVHKFIESLATI